MTFGRLSLKVPFTLLSRNHSRNYFSFFSYSGNHSHNSIFSLFSSSNHSQRSFSFLFFFRKSLSRFPPSFIQEAMLKVLFPFFFFFIGFFLLFSSGNHSQIIVQEHFLRALLLSTTLTWTIKARHFRWIVGSENVQCKYVWVTAHFAFGLQMICSSCFLVWRWFGILHFWSGHDLVILLFGLQMICSSWFFFWRRFRHFVFHRQRKWPLWPLVIWISNCSNKCGKSKLFEVS